MQMTGHEFLTKDRKVQNTTFGQDSEQVSVTVNFGDSDYLCNPGSSHPVSLPPLGFLVESPTFVAFYARNWHGLEYGTTPPLFTLRSLDQQPISKSHKVRIFHAFGDNRIELGKAPISVTREQIVDPNAD